MLLHFTSIDIAEMMELKEKAEEESRILLKIMEHYTQQENNQTAVSLDFLIFNLTLILTRLISRERKGLLCKVRQK